MPATPGEAKPIPARPALGILRPRSILPIPTSFLSSNR
jgi:hypothetical protein